MPLYQNVEEVKARISTLYKDNYRFVDICEGQLRFVCESLVKRDDHEIQCICIRKEFCGTFSEKEGKCFITWPASYRLYFEESDILDILDFYIDYDILSLFLLGDFPSCIRILWKCKEENFHKKIYINNKVKESQITKEMLGEISFAQEIIEEYACEGIYDILREYHISH